MQKSNDPADLVNQGPQPGGGLNSDPNIGALKAKGPFIPDEEMKANIEQPKVGVESDVQNEIDSLIAAVPESRRVESQG